MYKDKTPYLEEGFSSLWDTQLLTNYKILFYFSYTFSTLNKINGFFKIKYSVIYIITCKIKEQYKEIIITIYFVIYTFFHSIYNNHLKCYCITQVYN